MLALNELCYKVFQLFGVIEEILENGFSHEVILHEVIGHLDGFHIAILAHGFMICGMN